MKIGIPKEIKNNENRVSCTPAGVFALCKAGHEVYVETNAGAGSGFPDKEYEEAWEQIMNVCGTVHLSHFQRHRHRQQWQIF